MAFLLLAISVMYGCSGDTGPAGTSAPTTGIISGAVTTSTGVPISGIQVSAFTAGSNTSAVTDSKENYKMAMALQATATPVATATTDGSGNYTMSAPPGVYTVTFSDPNGLYTIGSMNNVILAAGATYTVNAGMGSSVAVSETSKAQPTVTVASSDNEVGYGGTVNLTASATSPLGATLTYTWSGATATDATHATATMPTLAVAMGGMPAPANDPGGYVTPYVQENRFGVLPITADTRGSASPKVTVTDGLGGSTSATATLYAASVQPGIRNTAIGTTVYLNSGHDDPNSWTMTSKPAGSNAALVGASARNPYFKPDIAGTYTVAEGSNSMDIYAGKFVGAITNGTYVTHTVSADDVGIWAPTAGTYTNWPAVTTDSGCMFCHDDVTAPDEFTPWSQTAHATFFARGLDGITVNSGSCLVCHTTGYDQSPSAVNDGFDDMQALEGWSYPSTRKTGNWTALWAAAPQTARRSNIQCENCHGPQGYGGAHPAVAPRVSFSAEVCAVCHASGTGHHNYSEWLQLDPDTGFGHSNLSRAISVGTNPHCGRCHSAQGYSQYVDQLNAGTIGNLSPAPTWTTADVQPQTCTACHDPHDDSNPKQLRFFDSTPLLPSGFSVVGIGKGAVCVSCHNSRNGAQTGSTTATYLHEDGETYNGGNPTGYSAPHQACQGDVLMGHNAYFMGTALPQLSKHANVEDACVGCHIKLNPQTHLSHGTPAVSGHVMYIRDQDKATVCANCHSSNVNGEALVANVESLLDTLKSKLETSIRNKIMAQQASGSVQYKDGNTSATGTLDAVTASTPVSLEEVHGQIGFNIQGHDVQLGSFTINGTTTALVSLSDPMVKAGWNYFLVEGDSSKGIHNPSFVTSVLNNTIAVNF